MRTRKPLSALLPTETPARPWLAERGVAIVEFALVIPILLALTLGVIELARASNVHKAAAQLSREAANVALRNCNGFSSAGEARNCLNTQKEIVENFSKQLAPGVEVVISIYRNSAGAAPSMSLFASTTPGANPSKFSAGSSQFTAAVKAHPNQAFFIAEVFIPYKNIVGNIVGTKGSLFNFQVTSIYDATIA